MWEGTTEDDKLVVMWMPKNKILAFDLATNYQIMLIVRHNVARRDYLA